ncbi:small ribosomal subunit protein bS18m-like [Tubulanus polymorphus]|uniref:small ribosomal subunit protein bS18m-like n=1 Tax=Tubulanus polymorphus TaxID=672921 RepID=UPI003DA1EF46
MAAPMLRKGSSISSLKCYHRLCSYSKNQQFQPSQGVLLISCRHKWRTFGYQRFLPKRDNDQGVAEVNELKENNEQGISKERLKDIIHSRGIDANLENYLDPYAKCHKTCILCEHNIEPEYKNTQLLSQFVSPYTGRIYGRHVTGLCLPMQRRVSHLINRARRFGLMPFLMKETDYLKDPKLFNPFKVQK